MRVFEDIVVRRIFGTERDEATSGSTKMHSEKLHNLYSAHRLMLLS
jgi:hypothetical protein